MANSYTQPIRPRLSDAAMALSQMDRSTLVPPNFTNGGRDYHAQLLLHPAEVWGDTLGGNSVLEEAIRNAWHIAIPTAHSSFAAGSHPKVSYTDLLSKSWGSARSSTSATAIAAAAALSNESQLRWGKSAMYMKQESDDVLAAPSPVSTLPETSTTKTPSQIPMTPVASSLSYSSSSYSTRVAAPAREAFSYSSSFSYR